jgi:hypothetical protein
MIAQKAPKDLFQQQELSLLVSLLLWRVGLHAKH